MAVPRARRRASVVANQAASKIQDLLRSKILRSKSSRQLQRRYEVVYDEDAKRSYYYDVLKGKSTWKRPKGLQTSGSKRWKRQPSSKFNREQRQQAQRPPPDDAFVRKRRDLLGGQSSPFARSTYPPRIPGRPCPPRTAALVVPRSHVHRARC